MGVFYEWGFLMKGMEDKAPKFCNWLQEFGWMWIMVTPMTRFMDELRIIFRTLYHALGRPQPHNQH